MAKEVKQWITVNGVHVPIYEGESKDDAVKKAINKQKQAGKKVSEDKDSKGKINPVSKELEGRDRTIDGVKYTSEEQAEAVSYMYGVSLTDARQGIVDGKYGDKDIAKSVIYKEMTEDFQTANLATRKKIHEAYEEKIKKLGLDEDKTDKKSNNEHYDTKLNSIRDRLRNGEITPEQAKDEAFEYEKSQRDNKKWSDIDRNRMESKTRDIFKEADAKANASKNEDLKEKQIAQNKAEREKLEKMKQSSDKTIFGKEYDDKVNTYQNKFLKNKTPEQLAEIKKNIETGSNITGYTEQDHVALKAIEKEMQSRKSGSKISLSKMNTNQLRDLAVSLGADRSKLYGTSKQALIVLINRLR